MIDKRMPGFLLLSVLLHVGWLLLPLHHRAAEDDRSSGPRLAVHLSTAPGTALSAPATATPDLPAGRGAAPARRRSTPPGAETNFAKAADSQPPEPPPVPVDLRQALATARAAAKEWQAASDASERPALPPTIASAVAAASRSAVIVESRGAAGEWVTRQGRIRCVTPLQIPFYMAGKSLVTQCDSWNG